MLNAKDNEYISRIGPGTPMGTFVRRFWTPLMLASDLPEPDGDPKEVRIYGEDLVVFRDWDGNVGAIQALCPHRQAPLVYGRVEQGGIRCIYHGWLFDTQGYCLDMPNESPETVFKEKVRADYYPCAEKAGVVWIYMGPKNLKPELPDMEWMRVPEESRNVHRFHLEGNWVQAMEGDVDSSHIGFLHKRLKDLRNPAQASQENRYQALDKAPKWVIEPTDYGMMIAARRNAEDDTYYWRINQVMLPYYTSVAAPLDGSSGLLHIWVPMDDTHSYIWTAMWRTQRPMTDAERAEMLSGPNAHVGTYDPATGGLKGNHQNRFFQDRRAMKSETFSGIMGVREQDGAMTLGMGPIVDRSKEHLGSADSAVIALRRVLIKAARDLENGIEPHAPFDGASYRRRAWSAVLPRNDDFLNDPLALKMHESLVP
jgi:phenylpropionate dioxygenase-like ring-hydroxylating dioxygenase large terminal subunit